MMIDRMYVVGNTIPRPWNIYNNMMPTTTKPRAH